MLNSKKVLRKILLRPLLPKKIILQKS